MELSRYNPEYQTINFNTILKALETHPRLMVVRCDLRFPSVVQTLAETDSRVITRFFASLKAKIDADLKRKEKAWRRRLSCVLNYVWVREYGDVNGKKHYHVLLFVSKDIYHSLGDYLVTTGNLSAMISQAWCSATHLNHSDFFSLVHFGPNFYLDRNSAAINLQIQDVVACANYLAKNVTKRYGDGERSIGSSL
ncbi:inovirus Gp2 family protein [Alcaligenes sp. Me129]|uniref:inovirus Gp2 family protein n=1 Tax=Alcaligenes sp. Me129 TaxID=3392635 RepID=UPI003D22BA31